MSINKYVDSEDKSGSKRSHLCHNHIMLYTLFQNRKSIKGSH